MHAYAGQIALGSGTRVHFTEADDGSLHFREAVHLTGEDTRHVERTVQRRVLRHFVRRGLLEDYVGRDMLTWRGAGGFSIDASVRS